VFMTQTQVYCIKIIAVYRYNSQQRFIHEDNHGDCYPVKADFLNDGSEFPAVLSVFEDIPSPKMICLRYLDIEDEQYIHL
jgi:hypothetical protein